MTTCEKGYRSTDAGMMAITKERRRRSKRARRAGYNPERSPSVYGVVRRFPARERVTRTVRGAGYPRGSVALRAISSGLGRGPATHHLSIASLDRPFRGRHDPEVAQSGRRPAQASLMLVVLRARYLRAARYGGNKSCCRLRCIEVYGMFLEKRKEKATSSLPYARRCQRR